MNLPYFPFYVADFLTDEDVALMTNQEVGCYIKLLCYCWKEGSIPNDISKIAKLCGEYDETMAQLWLAISLKFRKLQNEETRLVNLRIKEERDKQEIRSKERIDSGRKGAISRWYKDNSSAKEQPIAKHAISESDKDIYPGLFEVFYEAFPKHKGKEDAKKAWIQKRKDIEPNFEVVMTSLKKQIPLWKDPKFIPYPATWLRGKRWEDEVDNNAGNNPYTGGWK